MDPLIVAAIGVVLLLAVLLGRAVARRPPHIRSDAEWRSALDRLRQRQKAHRSDAPL
jgi:hypothetical protein